MKIALVKICSIVDKKGTNPVWFRNIGFYAIVEYPVHYSFLELSILKIWSIPSSMVYFGVDFKRTIEDVSDYIESNLPRTSKKEHLEAKLNIISDLRTEARK